MDKILSFVIGCGILALALSANAEIYEWTDSFGTINFTDDRDKIPAKYPVKVFKFTKEHKWTVDRSDMAARNAFHLEALREFNEPAPEFRIEPPKTIVIIENHLGRNKRHRGSN